MCGQQLIEKYEQTFAGEKTPQAEIPCKNK